MGARTPQDFITQVDAMITAAGVSLTFTRFVRSSTPNDSVFFTDQNGTTETLTAGVIVEDLRTDLLPTAAGARPMEIFDFMANAGKFQIGDQVQYAGHTYQVKRVEPVNFMGTNVAEEIQARREVD